jgi:hypothetical protein
MLGWQILVTLRGVCQSSPNPIPVGPFPVSASYFFYPKKESLVINEHSLYAKKGTMRIEWVKMSWKTPEKWLLIFPLSYILVL